MPGSRCGACVRSPGPPRTPRVRAGHAGAPAGTGAACTRCANTGENVVSGVSPIIAQGGDGVAAIRTPEPIAKLDSEMPKVYKQLMESRQKLEQHYKEVQDI